MPDAPAEPPAAGPVAFYQHAARLILRGLSRAHQASRMVLGLLAVLLLAITGSGPLHAPDPAGGLIVRPLPDPLKLNLADALTQSLERVAMPVVDLVRSFLALFSDHDAGAPLLARVVRFLGLAVVLTLLGGALARLAAISLVRFERPRLGESLAFAWRRAPALIGSPLSPLVGLTFFALIAATFGLFFRLPAPAGPVLGGLFAFIPIALGVPMALLVIGQGLGWPLMVSTIAVDGEDAFDALSRSYSYVYQRFVRLVLLVAMAWILAALFLLVVALFVPLVLSLARWTLSLGSPHKSLLAFDERPAGRAPLGARMLDFWVQLVHVIAAGWVYSAFWSAVVPIYLLLRRDVDGTPIHEIHEPADQADSFIPDVEPPAEPDAGAGSIA
jgi:hypothetical protein